MNLNLSVKCQYCQRMAIGINYRPRPELDNAPACSEHQTSLFVPYHNIPNTSKGNFTDISEHLNARQAKNQDFFEELMNKIIGEFNLLKCEVKFCEEKMKKLEKSETYDFELPCQITNPYMILRQDKQMMVNTFLARIKSKCNNSMRANTNIETSGMKNSKCETINSLTKTARPFAKNSIVSSRSTNHKSEYTSPNKTNQVSVPRRYENIRL